MLGSLFGINKWVLGGVGVVGLAAVIYIGILTIQKGNLENEVLRQSVVIERQSQRIDALELTDRLKDKANEVLNDRLQERNQENQDLTSRIEDILGRSDEDDGPVAPILRDTVGVSAGG